MSFSLDWLFPWRPMDSAPRDGSPVMVRRDDHLVRAQYASHGFWVVRSGRGAATIHERNLDAWTPCLATAESVYP